MNGTLYGVGLGPGDPELMTVKAVRILEQTRVISYFCKTPQQGHAYKIAASLLTKAHEELSLVYPVTTEYTVEDIRYERSIHGFYEEASEVIAERLSSGYDVALIAVGDPFFYGSFMHMYHRLQGRFKCVVVPGVTAMSGAWTSTKTPITWGDDVLTVLPATMGKAQLLSRLKLTDAAVIMKLGKNFAVVRQALIESGMMERAIYIEYATMENEKIIPLTEKLDNHVPYFSLIVVPGNGRRL